MHLYIVTRGIKNWVDQFITELQGKYLPFKYHTDGKNIVDCQVQLSVRPIQLWEIVFPEDQKDLVLATILDDGKGGKTQHKRHEKFIWGLRKTLGVEKIPEYKSDQKLPITKMHFETVGIGIKKDYWVNVKTGE
ncbi:hypothetical protein M0R04_15580, partial [Candidatus Dojkabacteria bacterium]|nr:hypothetical protein [Candidatus Dojkabacteria bacterium]